MTLLEQQQWHGKVFSEGWRVPDGGTAQVVEPATGGELGRTGLAAATDVARAAELASRAQTGWARRSFEERAGVLRKAGDLLQRHATEVEDWIVREAGSIRGKAAFEVGVATSECYEASALPSHPYGEMLATSAPRLSFSRRVPAGVVGVIAPFNVPLILSIRSVAPALALGNSVVLKPDPRTAVSGGFALARIFEEAGLPDGLLHVLPGGAEAGVALVSDPHVRVISFTGSTATGRLVGELAARHLKRAHLELGGNSALVVLPDADVPAAISAAAWGSFFHQGQICMTAGRHLVHEAVVDDYVDLLSKRAEGLPVGNPASQEVALGPLIDAAQRDKVHAIVTGSISDGASLAAGGTFEGLFYRPTVLTGVTPAMAAYKEEIFGPVAPVMAFSSMEEAARLAAGSEYGLSLGILTSNPLKALELAELVPSGAVHINDQTVNDEAQIPFGGVGASGTGARFGGARANIEAFTETQWVTMRSEIASYPF